MKSLPLFLSVVFLAIIGLTASAQELEDRTLLTIDGTDYEAGTFIRTYLKNIDIVQDESQKDIDNYLELYIDYRLKLMQAYGLGLENGDTYKKELRNYRSTLAQGYLTDNEINDALVQEAYERMKREVKASHILVKIGRGDTPADTLAAWNKIQAIKSELDAGADFAQLARDRSEGPSARVNGDLGWFSAFRMAYPFETMAFETPVGEYSDVFRTDFGYHIVKVFDSRPNPGQLTVAHIMTFDSREATEKTAETRIKDIHKRLLETGNFEELAREFSDDMQTAPVGGKLKRFGTGGLNAPAFEKAAFELENPGDISQPIQTKYGWHIIKLLEKHPVESFEKSEKSLRDRIKRTPRSRKITKSFNNKLRAKYNVVAQEEVIAKMASIISDSLLTNSWKATDVSNASDALLTIKDRTLTYGDFYNFLEQQQLKDFRDYKDKTTKLRAMYNSFIDSSISNYYNEHLEEENKDFAFVYNEYKEGLLLFDLMERKIWNKAKEDSLGQQSYYDLHKEKYQWKRRLDIVLSQNTTEEVAQQVQQMLAAGDDMNTIKDRFNVDNRTKVIMSAGVVEETYNRLPDNFEVKEGVSDIYHDKKTGFYKVIYVKEIIEPSQKTLDEARGAVINDYQQQLEKEWLDGLRTDREISVNKKTLKKVKKHLAQFSE